MTKTLLPLADARAVAAAITHDLAPVCVRIEVAGSLRRTPMVEKICPSCQRPFVVPLRLQKRKYCSRACVYVGLQRLPETVLGPRFWQKVNKDGPVFVDRDGVDRGPCWEWTAGKSKQGYGWFKWNGRDQAAHRVAYTVIKQPIPDGLELDHLCRNRACVHVDADPLKTHLEPVTHAENARRGNQGLHTAIANLAKTHCPQGHPYDEENTYRWRDGKRKCRACRRIAWHTSDGNKRRKERAS